MLGILLRNVTKNEEPRQRSLLKAVVPEYRTNKLRWANHVWAHNGVSVQDKKIELVPKVC